MRTVTLILHFGRLTKIADMILETMFYLFFVIVKCQGDSAIIMSSFLVFLKWKAFQLDLEN